MDIKAPKYHVTCTQVLETQNIAHESYLPFFMTLWLFLIALKLTIWKRMARIQFGMTREWVKDKISFLRELLIQLNCNSIALKSQIKRQFLLFQKGFYPVCHIVYTFATQPDSRQAHVSKISTQSFFYKSLN